MASKDDRRLLGGTGPTHPADDSVQALADNVRPELEARSNRTFTDYKALEYRQQLVAGMNYFIKVQVEEGKCVHLRVYQDLQQVVTLTSFKLDKTIDEPLEYF